MSTKPETSTKSASAPTTKQEPAATQATEKPVRQPIARMSVADLKSALDKFDADIKARVNTTLEQMAPGTPFNPAMVRDIAKVEAKKNRLLTTRFAAMLKKGHPEAKAIVERLIAIEL